MSFKEQQYTPFVMKKDWHKVERKSKQEMTNAEYLKQDHFQTACAQAKVLPTKRQASKFRRKEGLAYKNGRLRAVSNE